MIKSKIDLSWHLGIDNPWQKRDLWNVAFKEARLFSHGSTEMWSQLLY